MPIPLSIRDFKFREAQELEFRIATCASVATTLEIRGITERAVFQFDHTTTADRVFRSSTIRIEDWPVFLVVACPDSDVRRGQVYCEVTLRTAGLNVGKLCSGYVYFGYMLSWPPGVTEGMLTGRGHIKTVVGTDPAPGNEVSETLPTNVQWRITSVYIALTTTLPAANRYVRLKINDGTRDVWYSIAPPAQAENTTRHYYFTSGYGTLETAFDTIGVIRIPLPPDLILQQGSIIATVTSNLGSADNFSAPRLIVEEWLTE